MVFSTNKTDRHDQGLKKFPKGLWSRTSEHQEPTDPEYRNGGNKIC
jgi:hypothetical protein